MTRAQDRLAIECRSSIAFHRCDGQGWMEFLLHGKTKNTIAVEKKIESVRHVLIDMKNNENPAWRVRRAMTSIFC